MSELGTQLVRAREARGLTLEDAERDTRISRRYLQALESEQFEAIPAPVYARGFLRSYSQYLGLDPQELLALFPRDDDDPGAPPYQSEPNQRASPENPISAVGASRPSWRRPQPARPGSPARRETVGQSRRQPEREYEPEYDDTSRRHNPREYEREDEELNRRPSQHGYDTEDDDWDRRRPQREYDREPGDYVRRQPQRGYDRIGEYDESTQRQRSRQVRPATPPQRARSQTPAPREPMIGVDIGVPAPARRIKTDPAAQTRTVAVVAVAIGAIIAVILVAFVLSRAGNGGAATPTTDPTTSSAAANSGGSPSSAANTTAGSGAASSVTPVAAGAPVKVPDVMGLQQAAAQQAITNAGLKVQSITQSATQPQGTVIDQAPSPDSNAVGGDTIHLVISAGQ